MPTKNLYNMAEFISTLSSAKQALKNAPIRLQAVKILLAGNRSAHPEKENTKVPKINPACTLMVNTPMSA
jgi:hypothetical protein